MTPYKKHQSNKLKSERKQTDKDMGYAMANLKEIIKRDYQPSSSERIALTLIRISFFLIFIALFMGGLGIFAWSLFTESWIKLIGPLIMIYGAIKLTHIEL